MTRPTRTILDAASRLRLLWARRPFSAAILTASLLAGIAALTLPDAGSTTIQVLMPDRFVVFHTQLALSSAAALVGAMLRAPVGPMVERAAMWVLGATFLVSGLGALILSANPANTGFLLFVALGVACVLRARQITTTLRVIRAVS